LFCVKNIQEFRLKRKKMAERGKNIQVRMNLRKVDDKGIKMEGPVSVHEFSKKDNKYSGTPRNPNPLGSRINGLEGLIYMIANAIDEAGYELEISDKEYQETIKEIKEYRKQGKILYK